MPPGQRLCKGAYAVKTKAFMDRDFLLETETPQELFHETAEREPIFDYHCHLSPKDIADNRQFPTLTDIWLSGDHYKWRVMRAAGIDESLITGGADPYEKFRAWASTVPLLIGNPLYHWTHMELQRDFGIREPLSEKTAPSIWERANALLADGSLSVKKIFERFSVYAVGTTDDPADSLEWHRQIAADTAEIGSIPTRVVPTFRPDKALNIEQADFPAYIEALSKASGVNISSADDAIRALEARVAFFAEHDCRAADHGLEYMPFRLAPDAEIERAFRVALAGQPPDREAADAYKTKALTALSGCYAKHGIVMQLHLSALRNASACMSARLGPDTGYDAVHDPTLAGNLAAFLSHAEREGGLPKTVLYSLNPKDYYPLATIMGGFQDSTAGKGRRGVFGKMQLGSAWWFCDHRDGMEVQLRVLASVGLLPAFIGMLTDSRSFLSYPRHEYFRRILCNLLGGWVENGEYPDDRETLAGIVRDISFRNAQKYFVSPVRSAGGMSEFFERIRQQR
jgi:glucuronate isomerase